MNEQEIEDIKSALGIAIEYSPLDSPEFNAALVALEKKFWRKDFVTKLLKIKAKG